MDGIEKIIIIGGGPAGLAASLYASRGQLNPLVIEGSPAGGQLILTSEVENYPGFPDGLLGPELIKKFRDQTAKFGTRFVTDNVQEVVKNESGTFEISTADGKKYYSQTVLVATGADAKWLGLESEQRLRGKGVSACATCDGFFFRDKVVGVVGGGDSAMEEAIFLTKFAKKVIIIHRRNEFRASKIMRERALTNEKIEVKWNSEISEVLGENVVEGVKLNVSYEGIIKEETVNLDGLFLAIGHIPTTYFLKNSGVLLDDKGYIYNSDRVGMEWNEKLKSDFNLSYRYMTNIPGLFAAGDCTDFQYRQAGTAVGMGIAAEIEAEKYLENLEIVSAL